MADEMAPWWVEHGWASPDDDLTEEERLPGGFYSKDWTAEDELRLQHEEA